MAERVGFEPTDARASPVFKTGAFNRSAISPDLVPRFPQTHVIYYHIGRIFVKTKCDSRGKKMIAAAYAPPESETMRRRTHIFLAMAGGASYNVQG